MAKKTKRGAGKSPLRSVMDQLNRDLQRKFEESLRGGRHVGGKLVSGSGPAEARGSGGAIPPSRAPARFRDVTRSTWTEEPLGVYRLEISCYLSSNEELWRKLDRAARDNKPMIFRTNKKVYKARVKDMSTSMDPGGTMTVTLMLWPHRRKDW